MNLPRRTFLSTAAGMAAASIVPRPVWADEDPSKIAGHRTIHGAQVSQRPNPVQPRYVYGADRDWKRQPFRLAAVLIEFSDRKHEDAHTAAMYEQMLFSHGQYLKTPEGEPSFGSLADWYRVQSSDRFEFTGKVFDWVAVDETYEGVHQMSYKDAVEKFLHAAQAKVRARDGEKALEGFDTIFYVHAGPIAGPTNNMLWSHQSFLDRKRYLITFEIDKINVLCHEFGHVLGLPDLYGKDGVRESFGPWCTMAAGYRGKYPGSFCAWSRTRLGWCKPTVVDATTPQSLVLRPIQTNPNDALIIPLNKEDGIGAEFLMLENRAAILNDAERQAGLFIWRIKRKPDGPNSIAAYELKLPGPADNIKQLRQNTRLVAWPTESAKEFVIPAEEGTFPVAIRNIRKDGDNVFFEIAPNQASAAR